MPSYIRTWSKLAKGVKVKRGRPASSQYTGGDDGKKNDCEDDVCKAPNNAETQATKVPKMTGKMTTKMRITR